jgi:hypothetical protein
MDFILNLIWRNWNKSFGVEEYPVVYLNLSEHVILPKKFQIPDLNLFGLKWILNKLVQTYNVTKQTKYVYRYVSWTIALNNVIKLKFKLSKNTFWRKSLF